MATATLRMQAALPADERDLWLRGDLGHWLGLRCGSRVEVIGGDVFVSWAAGQTAAQTFSTVLAALVNARGPAALTTAASTRAASKRQRPRDVRLLLPGDTDFALVDVERWSESMERFAAPWLGELIAIEVTGPDAGPGRGPGPARRRELPTRTDLARLGVPCYLLVDRAPDIAEVYVFAKPDVDAGRFTRAATIPFGETFRLPDPIGLSVTTESWRTWDA